MSDLFSGIDLAARSRDVGEMFVNLMLVNYLTHGIYLAQRPGEVDPPQDAITALFRDALTDENLNYLHVGTHVLAGAAGTYQLVSQVRSWLTGATSSSSTRSATPTLSGI